MAAIRKFDGVFDGSPQLGLRHRKFESHQALQIAVRTRSCQGKRKVWQGSAAGSLGSCYSNICSEVRLTSPRLAVEGGGWPSRVATPMISNSGRISFARRRRQFPSCRAKAGFRRRLSTRRGNYCKVRIITRHLEGSDEQTLLVADRENADKARPRHWTCQAPRSAVEASSSLSHRGSVEAELHCAHQ